VEKGFPNEPLLVASQSMGVVPKEVYQNRTVEATKDLHNLKLVRVGDFVISLRSFQGGIEYAYYDGIISPAYTVIVPTAPITGGYFRHLSRSRMFIELLQMCVTGIREGQNIDFLKLKNHLVPLPPREEQDQIVRYLDWKVSQINQLVNAKRKQITLIREYITSKIEASISLPDTELVQLQNVIDQNVEWVERENDKEYTPIGMYNRGRGIFHKPIVRGSDLGDSSFFYVLEDAVVFSGQFAWEGAVSLTSEKERGCIASHRYHLAKGRKGVLSNEYLWALMQTDLGQQLLNRYSRGGAGRNRPLNFGRLCKEKIPVPSQSVQDDIAKWVALYFALTEHVSLLSKSTSELRTRLISDVVTGKLDVRDVAIPEYEAVTEETDSGNDDEEAVEEEDVPEGL